ncbi:hypothetical protein Z043_112107, partial [Scleropages formosus]
CNYTTILNTDLLKPHSELEGEAPDGSFANKNGRHAVGHVDDFNALQQQILEGEVLVHKMEVMLQSSLNSGKALDHGLMKNLLTSTKTLHQILEEATSLLKMFWRAALPSTESSFQFIRKEQSMKDEIRKLRVKISEQEGLLKDTIERLRRTNRSKESMELFIVSQREVQRGGDRKSFRDWGILSSHPQMTANGTPSQLNSRMGSQSHQPQMVMY